MVENARRKYHTEKCRGKYRYNKELWSKEKRKIGIFGSYIEGKQKPDSDIDMLVEFERGKKTFDNYMSLKFFLEELLKNKVDLVICESIKPELRPYILKSVRYAAGS